MRRSIRLWGFGFLALLSLVVGAYALLMYGVPSSIEDRPFATEKVGELPNLWITVLWIHAVSSGIAILIGWVQFIKRIRIKKLHIHRMIGLIYSVMVTVGGITGLYLAWYASGGWIGKTGFMVLAGLWLYTLYRSLHSILVNRNAAQHGHWMIRNYALTCAAIALRIYVPLAAILFGITDTEVSFSVIAWLCWIPNLLIAELIINKRAVQTHKVRVR
ncbi:DUF2306 domain-containing protein [Paenibacillus sp. J5C_2022]|uniref:DUF2306 domain-containing protein n=1 Tax=Paenibacillus sp. J5C2022 TaxID=2977129 RepID=UPI0021D2AE79|nr:DUF2306 domain-containing protein [Paenibacillus sp. J5C2022]MCU6712911.1 DUF2306 domain-containing protein [Paenibacillus sp. J5C2022]